jgi:hypothetical protein
LRTFRVIDEQRFAVAKGSGQGLPPVRIRNDIISVLDNTEQITEAKIRVGEHAQDPNFGHLLMG